MFTIRIKFSLLILLVANMQSFCLESELWKVDVLNDSIRSPENQDPYNNYFPVFIGKPESAGSLPMDFTNNHSFAQLRINADEIGLGGGLITGIQFRSVFAQAIPQVFVSVQLVEVKDNNPIANSDKFEKVYEQVIDFPQGDNDLFFHFNEPFVYQGGDLIVNVFKSSLIIPGKNLFYIFINAQGELKSSITFNNANQNNTQEEVFKTASFPFTVLFFSWQGLKPVVVTSRVDKPVARSTHETDPALEGVLNEGRSSNPDGLEVDEFIFNETMTKLGGDFYYYFFQEWQNTSSVKGLSIYVEERPVPGMGALVMVKVEDQIVYRGMLRPNNQQIRNAVNQAISNTQSYFSSFEQIQDQLESDDRRGSGIF